jgi:hypothetical protein
MARSPGDPPSDRKLLWSLAVRKRRPLARAVLTRVIVGVAALSASVLLEVPRAPWARSLGLWPTLTGDWVGDLTIGSGRARPVFLAIRGFVPRRGRPSINGRARLCDQGGAIRDFQISGEPDNWRGTRFHFAMSATAERDWPLAPGELGGEWDGDAIRATGALVSRGPAATLEISRSSRPASPPRVYVAMHRGNETDFLTVCQNVRARD